MNKILFIVLLLFPCLLFSQNKISGQILDAENNAIEFATIQLLTTDHLLIKNEISDEFGKFEIEEKEGSYLLKISYIENTLFEKDINLIENVDLGVILVDNGVELQEIIIESKLKMKNNFDKYEITNISNSKLAKNRSTLEFLNIVPIINVTPDQKSIKIKNNKNALILVNGKNVGGNDIALSMLQSMPATDIKKIEVMENPGSNYRASDNGIINIIVNNSENRPFKVALNARSTQSFYNTQDGSGYLSFSKISGLLLLESESKILN